MLTVLLLVVTGACGLVISHYWKQRRVVDPIALIAAHSSGCTLILLLRSLPERDPRAFVMGLAWAVALTAGMEAVRRSRNHKQRSKPKKT